MRRFRKRQSWQNEATIDVRDQKRLKIFMAHERDFYNRINESMRMRLTAQPSLLATLTDHSRSALAEAASRTLPHDQLDPTAIGLLSQGDAMVLLEMVNIRSGIHPLVRRNIAKQIIDFYHDQAVIAVQSVPANMKSQQTFRQPLTFLEHFDAARKRHLQVPRSLIKYDYDGSARRVQLRTPYTQYPIVINETDDIRDKVYFNLVIIHQKPGKPPRPDTPWMVDFRQAEAPYLLEYAEMTHPYVGDFHYMARTQKSALT